MLEKLLEINKKKLDDLIAENAPYDKILKQSQKLDKYITKSFIQMNKHHI